MERGGWKTDKTMKAIYQNVFSEERIEVNKKIDGYFENVVKTTKYDDHKTQISHDIEKAH